MCFSHAKYCVKLYFPHFKRNRFRMSYRLELRPELFIFWHNCGENNHTNRLKRSFIPLFLSAGRSDSQSTICQQSYKMQVGTQKVYFTMTVLKQGHHSETLLWSSDWHQWYLRIIPKNFLWALKGVYNYVIGYWEFEKHCNIKVNTSCEGHVSRWTKPAGNTGYGSQVMWQTWGKMKVEKKIKVIF